MMTLWLLLLLVASSHIINSQSTTSDETCSDEEPVRMLERLLNIQQQLHQDQQKNHQDLLQQLKQLQQDSQTNYQELQQLRQQLQAVLSRLNATEKSRNSSQQSDCSTPHDCSEVHKCGNHSDGVYTVHVSRWQLPVEVYCDMTTDGGGWTVFQRRQDGSVDFYRNWNDYRIGFGHLTGEFWLGNDNLHLITSDRHQRLRVDLADWEGNTKYAEYDNFTVGSAQEKYNLTSIGTYSGTAGDSLTDHLGMKFSTKDQDNDVASYSCATTHKGAWWYRYCFYSNLNGHYYTGVNSSGDGVTWFHWIEYYSLKFSEMKIRPFYV